MGTSFGRVEDVPGCALNADESAWQQGFAALNQFAERAGHARVSERHVEQVAGDTIMLGRWVSKQRRDVKSGTLEPERVTLLEDVPGWAWDAVGAAWQQGFAGLKQYAERTGDSRVPTTHVEQLAGDELTLGHWVSRQRAVFKAGSLEPERVKLLEGMPGWIWDTDEASWQQGFAALTQFAERAGHTRVSKRHVEQVDGDDVNLGRWVSKQRRDFTAGSLEPERVKLLDGMPGWIWNADEASWQQGFAALNQFTERTGHARVPKRHVEQVAVDEIKIGRWVSQQRQVFTAGSLEPERAKLLEGMPGWIWDVNEASWQQGFAALTQYAAREGTARVPKPHVEEVDSGDVPLGLWVSQQRQVFTAGSLEPERATLLEGVPGWVWDVREADWQQGFAVLNQYVKREGHARVPTTHVEQFGGEDRNLGRWARQQREVRTIGKLDPERERLLGDLPDWRW